jgi:hypothetical protein
MELLQNDKIGHGVSYKDSALNAVTRLPAKLD